MMKSTSFALLIILFLFAPRIMFSQEQGFSIPAEQIDSVLVIQPISSMFVLTKGKLIFDSETSLVTTENVINGFKTFFPERISIVQPDLDTTTLAKIDSEIKGINAKLETSKKKVIKTNAYSMMFDSLMYAHQRKYLLVLTHFGTTRTHKQLAKEIALDVGFRILSGGTFGTGINSKLSAMNCFIFSRDAKGAVFVARSFKIDQEPTDAETTDRQIRQMFEEYFIPKKK